MEGGSSEMQGKSVTSDADRARAIAVAARAPSGPASATLSGVSMARSPLWRRRRSVPEHSPGFLTTSVAPSRRRRTTARPMSSTRITGHVNAPRERVYRALIDANAIARWKVPTGMTCHVHEFDPGEGGLVRISLTYDKPIATGKSTAHTDTYQGRSTSRTSSRDSTSHGSRRSSPR